MGFYGSRALTIVGAYALLLAPGQADARRANALSFDLPAQPLATALQAVAGRAQVTVAAPADLLDGRAAPALAGRMTINEALERLLRGSGLHAETAGSTIVIQRDASDGSPEAADNEVLVTGSRIRGVPIASTVIATPRSSLLDQGKADLGAVVRSLPQSFSGGQNPGIGQSVPESSGADVGGGSALNLRGLGADATLTLLNGHRLAYTAVFQSIDVSMIPIDILDRIEIMPDGASALYGSDAIAGVANIRLKPDYDGLLTSTVIGKATDGGDFQQQHGLLIGRKWASGGFAAAYEFGRSTAIQADQRDYAATRTPGLMLFPPLRHDSVVLTGHQDINDRLSASFDGLYTVRWSHQRYPTELGGDLAAGSGNFATIDRAYALAPTLLWSSGAWRAHLAGSYGHEKVVYAQTDCSAGVCGPSGSGFYRNSEASAEVGADGRLFTLPGGNAKLALGAGLRAIGFQRFSDNASNLNTRHEQDSAYAYGEVSVPLIGPANPMQFLARANLSAALRYERYPSVGQVIRPKLGLILGPTQDFDIKASWGKSFRVPTLYQQYQPRSIYLLTPSSVGGVDTSGASALIILGGNDALKPERATTWSATFDLHPRGTRLDIAATYFDVQYKDRIVAPVRFLSKALTDPIYASAVSLNPSATAVAATIASGSTFLNGTGAPLDPTQVIAIVDDGNVNAGSLKARGLDLLVSYGVPVGRGSIDLGGNVSYLASSQQLSVSQPITALAGTIFSPPHWRGQGTSSWRAGSLTLTGEVDYIGGVRDTRATPAVSVASMTTLGLTARLVLKSPSHLINALDLSLSGQNLLNAKPGVIATSLPYDTPYDSTNYSPVGRFVSLAIRTSW